MSGINQPISIGTEDPEYYAELLRKTPRLANRCLPSDERSRPDVPGIQNVNGPLAQRLQTLLDVVADISLCQRGNVSATMAYLKDDKGTLETRLYIVFNHEHDEAAYRCPQHLRAYLICFAKSPTSHLQRTAPRRSSGTCYRTTSSKSAEPSTTTHSTFLHIALPSARTSFRTFGYIEQDQTHFTPQHRSTLVAFLNHMDAIIKKVANAQTTKQLSTTSVKILLSIYSY